MSGKEEKQDTPKVENLNDIMARHEVGAEHVNPSAMVPYTDIRRAKPSGIKKIKDRIVKSGWTRSSTVIVKRLENGSYGVIDGWHRTSAVKLLVQEGELDASTEITLPIVDNV